MTRVLVCGGRDFAHRGLMRRVLFQHLSAGDTLIHGNTRGADRMSGEVCPSGVDVKKFPAKWNRYGASAGPIRNQQMLDEGKPDLVIAFPGGRGTADMVRRAELAGLRVIRVESNAGPALDSRNSCVERIGKSS